MAGIEKRGSRYHLNLEFRGQHFSRSLRTSNHKEAEGCRKRAEANLTEVERGRLRIPPGTDLIVFLLSDGEANGQLTVCEEPNVPMEPGSAHHHFRWTLDGCKWGPVHGWHTLRHSFCSNCAMKGLDQRLIDSWMGHQTEDMRRRYRHLFPDHQQHAMSQVFGKTA